MIVKALIGTFNKEKALIGAFSGIVKSSRIFVPRTGGRRPGEVSRVQDNGEEGSDQLEGNRCNHSSLFVFFLPAGAFFISHQPPLLIIIVLLFISDTPLSILTSYIDDFLKRENLICLVKMS